MNEVGELHEGGREVAEKLFWRRSLARELRFPSSRGNAPSRILFESERLRREVSSPISERRAPSR